MSIVTLAKVTLAGLQRDKTAMLDGLQGLGLMHLVSLRPPPAEPEKTLPTRAEDALKALKWLSQVPRRRRPVREAADFDMNRVVAQALANQQAVRDAGDRRDILLTHWHNLEPWGDFALPPLADMAGQRLWFYVVPLSQLGQVTDAWPVAEVHRDHHAAYLVLIAPEEPPADAMPVPRSHVGSIRLRDLARQIEDTEIRLEELAAEREQLTRWLGLIHRNLAAADDRAALAAAAETTHDEDGIVFVQGWLPDRNLLILRAFADQHGLALWSHEPTPSDDPPTLLENEGTAAGGEDVVLFYKTPTYRSWDPSAIAFFSFALFFAMITADAGYALVFLGVLGLYWTKAGSSATGRRLRRLGTWMIGMTLVYGVMVGSYFGVAPPPESLLGQVRFLDVNDVNGMMALSVVIGCLHVALANLAIAWMAPVRHERRRAIGWIVAIAGALTLWQGPAEAAGVLLASGLLAVAVFASNRPVNSLGSGLMRAVDGLLALTSLSTAFGDVLSYMRLFALGLASASLAVTFNQLASDAAGALPGLGLFLAILILLAGHTLNLALALMSGVVHGLRLNYIEFFRWALPGEGVPFRPFAKKETVP